MRKAFSIIGMVICVVIILMGVLLLAGALTNAPRIASYPRDSGFGSFGADFYEYVNNNAAEAASATRAVYNLIKTASGLLMMSIGALGLCLFGTKLGKATVFVPEPEKKEINSDELPDL